MKKVLVNKEVKVIKTEMKEVEVFETEDGEQFDQQWRAKEHEKELFSKKEFDSVVLKDASHLSDIFFDYSDVDLAFWTVPKTEKDIEIIRKYTKTSYLFDMGKLYLIFSGYYGDYFETSCLTLDEVEQILLEKEKELENLKLEIKELKNG